MSAEEIIFNPFSAAAKRFGIFNKFYYLRHFFRELADISIILARRICKPLDAARCRPKPNFHNVYFTFFSVTNLFLRFIKTLILKTIYGDPLHSIRDCFNRANNAGEMKAASEGLVIFDTLKFLFTDALGHVPYVQDEL